MLNIINNIEIQIFCLDAYTLLIRIKIIKSKIKYFLLIQKVKKVNFENIFCYCRVLQSSLQPVKQHYFFFINIVFIKLISFLLGNIKESQDFSCVLDITNPLGRDFFFYFNFLLLRLRSHIVQRLD